MEGEETADFPMSVETRAETQIGSTFLFRNACPT